MSARPNRNIHKPGIPGKVLAKWQLTVDHLCEIIWVPAGLITKVQPEETEIVGRCSLNKNLNLTR